MTMKKSTRKKKAGKNLGAKKVRPKAKPGALSPHTVKAASPNHLHFHWPWDHDNNTPTGNAALHQVIASSFADPADVAAFKKCKANGGSDQYCFKFGDNGIGFMGDDCTGPTPMCALPPDDWKARWKNSSTARLKPVVVTANGRTVVCLMGDTMPAKANITNGAGIDLSPSAAKALGLKPPFMVAATWSWQADE
jgi:hypothetical protein